VPTIDGIAFAREGGALAGVAAPERLGRLHEMDAQTEGLEYQVTGRINAVGRPALAVTVAGSVAMTCQRCLEPVSVPVNIAVELELRESQREIELADDDVDRALASKTMDVVALVEDEVLLDLPMSPRHETCEAAAVGDSAVARTNPFAALAKERPGR